jgi:hypothetical protein
MARGNAKYWALAAILVIAPFSAFGLTVDGNLSDWGVAAPTQQDYNDWTPSLDGVAWTSEDWVIPTPYGEYVGPGYGGQIADAEAMYMYLDGQTLYFGLACGVGPFIVDGYVLPGDVFFDFGSNGSWDAAVSTVGAVAGGVWTGSGDSWYIGPQILYTDQGPYEVDYDTATSLGDAAGFAYNAYAYGGEHWVLEIALALTDEQYDAVVSGGVSSHWTQVCGNDVLDLDLNVVPEPSTLILFGIAAVGFLTRRRFAA